MKPKRLLCLLALPFLCLLQACPDRTPEASAAAPPTRRERPAEDAIEVTYGSDRRFCCDPNQPFPQTVGTMTLTNTNTRSDTAPIYVYFNFGDGKSTKVDAEPNAFALNSGESRTVTIVARSCDFTTETMPLEWGYELLRPEVRQTLTVTNACPANSQVLAALSVLCASGELLQLFHSSYVVAAIGVLVQHSSLFVPAALITMLFTEITGYGGFPVFLNIAKILAAFSTTTDGEVSFPEGQGPEGYTVYPDMPLPMDEGDYLIIYQVVEEEIPIADPQRLFQFGFVFDADGDTFNNYQPQHPFQNDFFRDTDRWYAVTYSPQNGWHLQVTDARNSNLQQVASAAKVIIRGNAMILVVPASEFGVARPRYRVTSFAHLGDFGLNPPHVWSGDPTPPVNEPLAEIR